jgi:phosphoenolpyruvate carboxykinase (ATP)
MSGGYAVSGPPGTQQKTKESVADQLKGTEVSKGVSYGAFLGSCEFFNKDNYEVEKTMSDLGLEVQEILHNAAPAVLYEMALQHEEGSHIVSTGALSVMSGKKTGRSPKDKRTVDEPSSSADIWWGKVNIKLDEQSFLINRERAVDYLNTQKRLFVIDGWAGWDKEYRIPIRVITTRAYHALFMQNMLVVPEPEELELFTKPFIIYNAGCFPANRRTSGMTSTTSVAFHMEREEMVILGTQYAGEMKKGVFSLMMYHMPLKPARNLPLTERALPLHSSCNIGKNGDVTLFFGLSGTGKTTLSADPNRDLIGDDEHVWTSKGVFNIEGGCYAKCIDLTREKEPEIFDAIRFGSVLENVVFDAWDRVVDFTDVSVTENTRCAYPLQFISNARVPAVVDEHPSNCILLTCDAFGILPPVSKLTPEQVMYHFISGYTAKVAGTEMGITEPQATFSACFGGPFLMWHPYVYAEMLAAKLETHKAPAYLVNTGWVGGGYGVGNRCSLKYTRMLVDAIHDGTLAALGDDEWVTMPRFGFKVPKNKVKGVPVDVLHPQAAWASKKREAEYDAALEKLSGLFQDNFKAYADRAPDAVLKAGPQ